MSANVERKIDEVWGCRGAFFFNIPHHLLYPIPFGLQGVKAAAGMNGAVIEVLI